VTKTARCPRCKLPSHTPHAANPHAWYCHHCHTPFEDIDDGDIAYGRPCRRLERREAHRTPRRPRGAAKT